MLAAGRIRCLVSVIERVKLFRKVVLNPYSHASPPNIARAEVAGAIAAVDNLLVVLDAGRADGEPFESAQALIAKTPPSTEDMHAALGFLRVAFLGCLHRFCDRKHLHIAYRQQNVDSLTLWQAVLACQATLFAAPHNGAPAQIDAERRWLIAPVAETDLAALTHSDLIRLVGVLSPPGSSALVLDTI